MRMLCRHELTVASCLGRLGSGEMCKEPITNTSRFRELVGEKWCRDVCC